VPAPDAERLARHAASAETAGVRVVARAEAWSGVPQGLADEVTPLLVTVVNESDRPIRVTHEDFALVGADGARYAALAPRRIEGVITEAIAEPAYPPPAFVHDLSRPRDPYWTPLGPVLRYIRLPTLDMVRRALPEGVVEPGGAVTGFVYFERLPPDPGRVELRASLPGAAGERMTRVEIAFQAS
jgi:hypothetical protein